MDMLSHFFASLGIPPLLGGILIGAVLVFLLMRRSGERDVRAWGGQTTANPGPGKFMSRAELGGTFSQVHIENNGQPFELSGATSAELLNLLRKGDKIGAIKLIRAEAGLDLAAAKQIVDAMERSGLG